MTDDVRKSVTYYAGKAYNPDQYVEVAKALALLSLADAVRELAQAVAADKTLNVNVRDIEEPSGNLDDKELKDYR